jgi:hypothetical protein
LLFILYFLVYNYYAACGTFFGANSEIGAGFAFCAVDFCIVIFDFYCTLWANSLAFFAAYTAIFAHLACECALVLAAACDKHSFYIV